MIELLVYLLPQVAHVDIDDVGVGVKVLVPHIAQQLSPCKRLTLVAHHVFQEPILLSAQIHLAVLPFGFMCGSIDAEITTRQRSRLAIALHTSQQRRDACQELSKLERLDHVVVGSGLQTQHDVVGGAQRGEATVSKSFSSNLKYGLESIRSTVTYAEELADGDEEPVADFEKWISDVKVEKKAVSFKVSENKGELPRVAYIRFEVFDPAQSDGIPVNATLVVTQTTGDPELVFASAAEEVEGIAGEVLFATLSNNIWPYNDQIVFECEADWVSGIRLTSEGLVLKVSRNDGTDVRSTDIRISFTDALGNKVEAIVRLTQVAYPLELTMENLRGMLSSDGSKVIDDFVYMDGYVVSDCTSPNIVSSPQTGQFMFDREYNYRVAYMQTKDGRYGIKLVFNDSEAAAIPRFSKLRLLVQGLTLTRVSDPVRYELSGITADNVIETQAGDMTSVAVKAKSLSELCDDDIYTYVNIPDMEVFCKDGAYANATDGYSLKDEVNPYSGTDKAPRWDVAPLLCTDINGNAAISSGLKVIVFSQP